MKKNLATYHVPGYKPRAFAFESTSEEGKINLLDGDGEIVVRGVPLYEDPDAVEGKPNGYCTPGVEPKALDKTHPRPKPAEAESDRSDRADKSEAAPKAAKKAPREYTLKEEAPASDDQGILGGD